MYTISKMKINELRFCFQCCILFFTSIAFFQKSALYFYLLLFSDFIICHLSTDEQTNTTVMMNDDVQWCESRKVERTLHASVAAVRSARRAAKNSISSSSSSSSNNTACFRHTWHTSDDDERMKASSAAAGHLARRMRTPQDFGWHRIRLLLTSEQPCLNNREQEIVVIVAGRADMWTWAPKLTTHYCAHDVSRWSAMLRRLLRLYKCSTDSWSCGQLALAA